MSDTLRNAQLAYDRQLPDDSPTVDDWLETDSGDNWLYDSARDLIRGVDLKIGGRTVLCCSELIQAVDKHLEARIAQDSENLLTQIVLANLLGRADQHLAQLLAGGKISIQLIAEALVLPFAEQYLESLTDQAMDKGDI